MKFEDIVEDYTIAEWKEYYLNYEELIKMIKKMKLKTKKRRYSDIYRRNNTLMPRSMSEKQSWPERTGSVVQRPVADDDVEMQIVNVDSVVHRDVSNSQQIQVRAPLMVDYDDTEEWEKYLLDELDRVEKFYQRKMGELNRLFDYFFDAIKNLQKQEDIQSTGFMSILMSKDVHTDFLTLKFGYEKVISEIYSEALCLESYQLINVLAMNKVAKQLILASSSSIDVKQMLKLLKLDFYKFSQTKEITDFKTKVKDYVVEKITKGDRLKARDILRSPTPLMELSDIVTIAFLFGVITSTLVVLAFTVYIEFNQSDQTQFSIFFSSFKIYRFVFCLFLALWYVAMGRYVLRLKHLNFFFVMDIRPKNLGDFHDIVLCLVVLTIGFLLYLVADIVFSAVLPGAQAASYNNAPGLLLFMSFFLFWFLPFKKFLKDFRFSLMKLILECFGAPFTRVKFIHTLVADCMTSLNKTILDLVNSTCWVYLGQWRSVAESDGCNFPTAWQTVIVALPYWIRFCQCIRRYYDTRLVHPNLTNALKYTLSLSVIILGASPIHSSNYLMYPFLTLGFISYFYNNFWDNYCDWGLFRVWSGKKKYLRKKIRFSPKFYFTIAIINSFLRLGWLATLISKDVIAQYFSDPNLFQLVTNSMEITRRFLWGLIRVEHEIVANAEQLRDYLAVPTVFYLKGKRKIQPL